MDDGFFVFEVAALLLGVSGVDGFWVVIRNESSFAELIGERFGSADKIVKILEFCCNSFNAEANANLAFFLCL